jgi:isoleucyl-tRNA synthetase
VAISGDITVALDTTISEALKLEGLARELISKVQHARKEAGLEVEDRIILSLRSESAPLNAAISAHGQLIAAEVLAVGFEALDIPHDATTAGSEPLEIGLKRA